VGGSEDIPGSVSCYARRKTELRYDAAVELLTVDGTGGWNFPRLRGSFNAPPQSPLGDGSATLL
jgi:hypothetical protein